MKKSNLVSVALALFLQFAPFATRAVQSIPGLAGSPVAIVLQWVIGALAVAGTYHTVSAASAVLASPTNIRGTVGTRLSYQIKITSDGETRTPQSWVVEDVSFASSRGSATNGLPPGMSLGLATGIISGTPRQGGTFPVTITAFRERNFADASLTFTLNFDITGGEPPPSITAQPTGGSVPEGGQFTFTVAATGPGTLVYRWQHNGTDIPGATSASLLLDPVTAADAGEYHVIVSNGGGSVNSSVASLEVTPAATGPTIETQPESSVLHAGEQLTLSVAASGSEPISYQWKRNGEDVAGGTEAALTIPSATEQDRGEYSVVLSNSAGTVTSATAQIEVVPLSIEMVGINPNGASLRLRTIAGRSYSVEAATKLDASDWEFVAEASATEDTTLVLDPSLGSSCRFWRCRPNP